MDRPPRRLGEPYEVWRHFTVEGQDPWETVTWERRTARLVDAEGATVFAQEGVEVPATWSQLATDLVASRYFAGALGSPGRESSVRHMIGRVVRAITGWVAKGRYLASDAALRIFRDELTWLLLHQRAAFNSPVWFNAGVGDGAPQCSACFIVGVEDRLDAILDLAATEGRIFSKGSGSGTNFSSLRGSHEATRTGGTASGPVAFLRGLDALAGAVKSGGRTRRAAKMAILDADHPDLLEFVRSKASEEDRARALAAAGLAASADGGPGSAVGFQNENHSVRVTDAFLRAVGRDGPWTLRPRVAGGTPEKVRARVLFREIAAAAHACGDPGLQFADTIASWNPVPRSGEIRASNPCSEFLFLDDTACNLASLNLLAFRDEGGSIDADGLEVAVRTLVLAMDAIVSGSSYPTERIDENSRRLRPLGLGIANLGSLLLARGLAYDSDAGRGLAATVAALVGGEATRASADLAARVGPFAEWGKNRVPALRVVARHLRAAGSLPRGRRLAALQATDPAEGGGPLDRALHAWRRAAEAAKAHGLRNAQVTCVAPTGTISFLMDCDTTGIEPELALVKEKKLVGGGRLRLVNQGVRLALARLGYAPASVRAIASHVERTGSAEGAPDLRPEHVPVFDTAVPPTAGGRAISPRGHLLMMAAVQPFVSGAISKTVNLPSDAAVEDVEGLLLEAWRLGIKAVAVYRDRSKVAQPLSPLAGERAGAGCAVGPVCAECGAPLVRGGACAVCTACGASTGCG